MTKKIIYILLTIILIGVGGNAVFGQNAPDTSVVMNLRIVYPVNDTRIHENYMSNARMLPIIQEYLQKSPKIDSITIFSYSSPEGPLKTNQRLAVERGINAKKWLLQQFPAERKLPESIIKIDPTSENWEGLYAMVSESYPYEDKDDILQLLENNSISNERKKIQLKKLNGGKPWKYIKSEIIPHLRYATWVAVWSKITLSNELPIIPQFDTNVPIVSYLPLKGVDTSVKPLIPIIPEVVEDSTVLETTKTILALKSNLLYDLATLLNFSIEFPVYKEKLSFLYYHQAPWWNWGMAKNEYCLRFLSIGGEARWWFAPRLIEADEHRIKRDKFSGHFFGIYGESGKYDFEHKTDICRQGEFWSAGLSYGYAFPIGKRMNLELSISAGYASIAYRGYTPSEDYEILWRDPQKIGRWHYLGPTKAQVSLVIPITVKTKSGGEQ